MAPQCHNFGSTAGAAAPAVNMLEEALNFWGGQNMSSLDTSKLNSK